jgi:hypothetical protein
MASLGSCSKLAVWTKGLVALLVQALSVCVPAARDTALLQPRLGHEPMMPFPFHLHMFCRHGGNHRCKRQSLGDNPALSSLGYSADQKKQKGPGALLMQTATAGRQSGKNLFKTSTSREVAAAEIGTVLGGQQQLDPTVLRRFPDPKAHRISRKGDSHCEAGWERRRARSCKMAGAFFLRARTLLQGRGATAGT